MKLKPNIKLCIVDNGERAQRQESVKTRVNCPAVINNEFVQFAVVEILKVIIIEILKLLKCDVLTV